MPFFLVSFNGFETFCMLDTSKAFLPAILTITIVYFMNQEGSFTVVPVTIYVCSYVDLICINVCLYRWPTDIICLVLFVVFVILMFAIGIYCELIIVLHKSIMWLLCFGSLGGGTSTASGQSG